MTITNAAGYTHKPNLGPPLTDLQAQAFRLAGDGLTHREIGEAMGVSTSMAKQHIGRVRAKLGISNKRELVVLSRTYFA